jgi:hypothetical protein
MWKLPRPGIPFQARLYDVVAFPLFIFAPWLFRF